MSLEFGEVVRRMPSLQLIDDDRIRRETAHLTADAPQYFWERPAAFHDYHHPACRRRHGLWAHTLMLSTVIERLADSYVEQGRLEPREIDYAHAAAVLHDQRKSGPDDDPPEGETAKDHDLQMAEVIYDESTLPAEVAYAVEAHMGPWYEGTTPSSDLEDLVHTADMVASTASISPAIPAPMPYELSGVGLEEVDLCD